MNFESFKELVLTRQSCRDFNGKEIEKEKLQKILETGLMSPSACNSQPWKIYCVVDKDKRQLVAKSLQDNGMNPFASNAGAFLVLTETDAELKERVSGRFSSNHFVKYDIGELTAYLTLTAKSLGVESCILGWINEEKLKEAVGMDKNENSYIVIALGYSDIAIREKKRKPIESVVKYL
ncbi:MAG: nitroreductase family protein [Clostridia bacterium]|nr:nitroreductase family protein [Clostridia bacterium]